MYSDELSELDELDELDEFDELKSEGKKNFPLLFGGNFKVIK